MFYLLTILSRAYRTSEVVPVQYIQVNKSETPEYKFVSKDLSELQRILTDEWSSDASQVQQFLNKIRNSRGIKAFSKNCFVFSVNVFSEEFGIRRVVLRNLQLKCRINHEAQSKTRFYEISIIKNEKSADIQAVKRSWDGIPRPRSMNAEEIQSIYQKLRSSKHIELSIGEPCRYEFTPYPTPIWPRILYVSRQEYWQYIKKN